MENKISNTDFIEQLIYLLGAFVLSFFNISIFLYIAFLYTVVFEFKKFFHDKKIFPIIKIIIASIIIPNNYIITIMTIIVYLLTIKHKKNVNIYAFILIFVLIFSIIINFVGIMNVSFGLLYLLPSFIIFSFFEKFKNEIKDSRDEITNISKQVIKLQVFAIVVYAIRNFKTLLMGGNANDWLTGTFGYHQGNILLYYMLFSILVLKESYDRTKSKKDMIYIFISIIICILTNSIALTLLFILSYFVIVFIKSSIKKKIMNLGVLILILIIFMLLTPKWIQRYIIRLTDFEYFSNTVAKFHVYEDTFVNIPKNDIKFFIVGNGMGGYSSRAALTCTGSYIDSYSTLFKPSITAYTEEYILKRYIKYNIQQGQGTLYSPFSSILTIQGEYGIVGTILFLTLIYLMIKKSGTYSNIFILFFFFSCFIENYVEFEKVMALVFILYFMNQKNNIKLEKDKLE